MKFMILAMLFCAAALLPAAEEVVYRNDFNSEASLKGWHRAPAMRRLPSGGIGNSGCVLFDNTKEDDSSLASIPLNVELLRGRAVLVEGWMKAEDLTKPKLGYLGPKLMLGITGGDGGKSHPDQEKAYGTYDWRKFTVFARIPHSAAKVDLCIGLQGCKGKLWIDDVKVTLLPAPAQPAGAVRNTKPVQKETKFRGVMSGGDLSPAAFRELREVWNANLMRYQIKRLKSEDHTTKEGFRKIIERNLKELDEVIPIARQNGIRLLIDMHVGPGTSLNELLSNKLSWEPEMQQLLADVWREIAEKYRDEPVIWGYDLLNEPREENYVYTPDGGLDWNRLAEKVAKAIREVDPDTPIIVESAQWGSAAGFENLVPIDVPNVIYSFHIYSPAEYTHQGIYNRPEGIAYPGMIAGKMWNRAALEKEMAPVVAFQKKYNVPVYVGEFGVARWAPGAEQWLDDAISVFEKYGWDWTYHAFREYQGWDAEIGPVKADTRKIGNTPRREVLIRHMKRNRP
ncbi:MAG: cellulase family glycosylhydrolase [Lentisphaeria bacterium]|nr:cellulase family glycosylhydrolase [Lentisphaeria bacterium]